MMGFPARFQDQCEADCGTAIRPGDMVRYDEDDQLVHVSCYIKEKYGMVKVCTKCNMQKPCECDE